MKYKVFFALISILTCSSLPAQEICDNQIDDDNDGALDFADCDCINNRGNVWHFGPGYSIDFNGDSPRVLSGSPMESYEGSSSICDEAGNLLFFTNGGGRPDLGIPLPPGTIWDQNGDEMYDMMGTQGGGYSAQQSSVIVPKPGSSSNYYLFTMDEFENSGARGLRYFEIDMNANGGLGEVVVANEELYEPTSEALAAVKHENGEDYWIIISVTESTQREFLVFEATGSGIRLSGNYSFNIGPLEQFASPIKASPAGDRINQRLSSEITFFDFDNSTGVISNPVNLSNSVLGWGDFSPSGRYYYFEQATLPTTAERRISRIDLSNLSPSSPVEVLDTIILSDPNKQLRWQLGPLGQVYFFEVATSTLGSILCPDSENPSVDPQHLSLINTPGADFTNNSFGLPNFPNHFFFRPDVPLELTGDTLYEFCGNDSVSLSVQSSKCADFLWSTGETTNTISVTAPGLYTVTATDGCETTVFDTILVDILQPIETFDTLLVCPGDTVQIFGNAVTDPDDYSETFITSDGCDSVHTITLIPTTDTIFFTENTIICQDSFVRFDGQIIEDSGTYVAVDSSSPCIRVDSLNLTVLPETLTQDTLAICASDSVEIFGELVSQPGTYSQTVTGFNGCDSTDQIELVLLDTFSTLERLTTCANEPVDIFGVPTSVGGEYQQTFMAQNGCDSLHTIQLSVLDTASSLETLTICWGDTVDIFGNPTTTSGTYRQTFTAANGCDSSHTIVLTVLDELNTELVTQDVCQGQQNGMISSTTEGGLPPYTYNWSNGQLGSSTEGLIPGEYDLTVTDSNGCTLQSTTEIEFFPLPQLELLPEDVNCFGEANGTLQLETSDSSLLFSLDGNSFNNTNEWISLEAGSYTLFVQDSNGCESEIPFNIQEPATPISVTLPVSLDLELGDDLLLQPRVSPEGNTYDYFWSPGEGLSCAACPAPLAEPFNTTTYSLVVTDTSGCSAKSSVRINVINNVNFYIPNAFTPNLDGINDSFTVFSESGLVLVKRLLIFDRWGEKIFERTDFATNNMSLGWDGRFRGQLMNPGVFVYLAEIELIDGSLETVSGSVTLIR